MKAEELIGIRRELAGKNPGLTNGNLLGAKGKTWSHHRW
jgi:hypothetical protein